MPVRARKAAENLRIAVAAGALFALAACAPHGGRIALYQPPAGTNEVLKGPIAGAPGHSLVMGDLVMGPGGTIPRHRHAGEEFLYILGGSATLFREGEAEVTLTAGQSIRIAPGVVHWGKTGPDGMRAVSSWVVVDGRPLREAVSE
ncbi:MAG TPA: dimethylsulfonioproprionate lyase family protein [Sphingomonadaceae bacterium]|nr:dimethylsulfonioproprionate lyase family protein [Sphingomonadaceae bacterium]